MANAHAVHDAMNKFQSILNEFIFNTAPAVDEYLRATKNIEAVKESVPPNSLYVSAVLYDGCPHSEYYTMPKLFPYNNIEMSAWMGFFNLPDTLKTVYSIVNTTNPPGFKPCGFDWDRCEVEEYKMLVEKVSGLKATLMTMESNLLKVQCITEEEIAFSRLLQFDHFYDYSDDISVWRSGREQHSKVVEAVKEALAKNPDLIKVVKEVSGHLKLSESFFTG